MKRFIELPTQARKDICKAFGVTKRTLTRALNFSETGGDSELARRIRTFAFQKGGHMAYTVTEPEVFFDSLGNMVQLFPGKVRLTFNKTTGSCTMSHEGAPIKHWEKVYVSQIAEIQAEAELLSRS